MLNERTNKHDFWYLSMIPVLLGLAFFVASQSGVVLVGPLSGSPLPTPAGGLGWLTHAPDAVETNGLALLVLLGGTLVGVLLFTWIGIMMIDSKRAAYRWYEQHRLEQRGAVTGMLREAPPALWSSMHVDKGQSLTYRVRFSVWVRHTFTDDRTSGTLATERAIED